MPCYNPLNGYQLETPNENGKKPVLFTMPNGGVPYQSIELPCGRCIGCRLERSRQWALRCMHEAQMFEDNCFITLTYAPENIPEHGTLRLDHWQKFMKRYRKRFPDTNIRFFMCGEYGENLENSRNGMLGHPHYHACVFNHDFSDKQLHSRRDGIPLYRSPTLERLWPYGFSTIGEVTFESAAYVARYVVKKQLGKNAKSAYEYLDESTGEVVNLKPEFTTMSRRPGIGKTWYDKYKGDLKKDFITARGVKMMPPKYYDSQLEIEDEVAYELMKERRKENASEKNMKDDYYQRLADGEKIKTKKSKLLIRNL